MRAILGAVALSLGLSATFPVAAVAQDATRDEIRGDLIRVVAAGQEMLEAQSDFNAAYAAGDRGEMKEAALDLAWASAAAAFNAVMLDLAVTPENTTTEVDAKAAELRALADTVFRSVVPTVMQGDFDALNARLDESAEALNSFFLLTRGISDLHGLRGVI
jgi:hypothetical protein